MPLAQLKEPWPLMELVPLDPEPGSSQGRGGPKRGCRRECPPISCPLDSSAKRRVPPRHS
ncbi:hypothetical protein P7K49_015752 [Saguinus oedipus]|uniref:Uncharacterized protein n=1 Tax=Saguinus oedipus TaxID=9490 RepID=A0ABQ9VC55_SAGOE|nr:hypothetical protein P7K49_015752 [Saguinus oedipus]